MRRMLLGIGFLIAGCALGAGLYSLGLRFHLFVTDSDFFKLTEIEIGGASELVSGEIEDLVFESAEAEGGWTLFDLSIAEARDQIESLPRVKIAEIRKIYPGTLKVEIQERRPLVAANSGGLFWVDSEGVLLDWAAPSDVADHGGPILTGLRSARFLPGVQLEQPLLAETLQTISYLEKNDRELGRRFSEWHLNAEDEVVGILKEGVEVRFGANSPLSRLAMLASVLREKEDLRSLTYFDLRFESQVIYY